MEQISYKLSSFEGPLDLLLHLISKNKLNIYDIKISQLLEQYMEHINAMKEENMDIASEFLEMAARLVYIKTVSLLPKHEEADELKKELTGQLIEYQECKRIAEIMANEISFDSFSREPAIIDFDMTYTRNHKLKELLTAYANVVGKGKRNLPAVEEKFSVIVSRKIVSVTSKIVFVLRKMWKDKEVDYDSLFVGSKEKSELVATFLAVLELIKGKRVRVDEEKETLKVKLINGGVKNWKLNKFNQQ